MRCGDLTERLTLLRPIAKKNGFGEKISTEYEPTGTIHAERSKQSGRLTVEAGEMFSDYSTRYNIRIFHEVGEGWHVIDETDGGREYKVTNVILNSRRQMKTIVCEAIND